MYVVNGSIFIKSHSYLQFFRVPWFLGPGRHGIWWSHSHVLCDSLWTIIDRTSNTHVQIVCILYIQCNHLSTTCLTCMRMLTKCPRGFTSRSAFLIHCLKPSLPLPSPKSSSAPGNVCCKWVILYHLSPIWCQEWRKKGDRTGVLMPMTTWIRPMAIAFLFVCLWHYCVCIETEQNGCLINAAW